ncbi:MAG: translation initiation factor IF-3, partial [Caldilineales bacterium]|nr:translation initiation factor IF-3 [Caldilineales bacterium]
MNERIRAPEVRVIDQDGTQLGIMTPEAALALARERNLDLVEVAPHAQPPVCRL